MALALYDRVQESTVTAGTGSLTLLGALAGYQSFAVVGDTNTCYYTIIDGSAWEVGLGTYSTTGPTLARTTVYSNSNGNTSPITLSSSANTKQVFLTYPAEKSINYDADGVATIGEVLGYSDTGVVGSFTSTTAGYNQVVIQNKSSATNASANLNVSNNVSTASTGFAELGINSSTFTGTGSFNIPSGSYLASAGTDLTIGTYNAYDIHFVTNSNTTDSMTIFDDGSVSLGGLPSSGIGNIACNNINLKFQQIVTAAGTTTLTNASPYYTQFTGTTTQIVVLPDATSCLVGTTFVLDNDSTGIITIKDGAGTSFETIISGSVHNFILENNGTIAGTWIRYGSIPSTVDWGTSSLQLGSTVITGGTWNGGTIAGAYGGTGLTTFTAANNALYSTSSSALTAGTLPVPAGGTGQTAFSSGYIPYGNSSAALQSSNLLQFNGSYLQVGGGSVLGGATNPIAAFTQSTNNYVQTYTYNANAGASASSDFVAYTDNSTDAHGWADIGYTSSVYADAVYTVTGPNEAYLLGSAPSGAGATGNFVYATDNTGSANAHQWYVGGFTQSKSAYKMQLGASYLELKTPIYVTGSTGTAGQILTSAGTGAAPTWENSGTYSQWTTSGSDIYYNTGNVSIGTSTAFSKFGVSTTNGNLGITGGNTSGGSKIQSFGATTTSDGYLAFEGYTAEWMRITSTGNVGIGTATPQAKLHANSANNATSLFLTPNSGATAGDYTQLGFGNSASSATVYAGIRTAFTDPTSTSSVSMQFWTDSGSSTYAERMRIDQNGNVGIGISPTVSEKLAVKQAAASQQGIWVYASATDSQGRFFCDGSSVGLAASYSSTGSYLPITFTTSATEQMRITAAGNVGIGTTSPNGKFESYANSGYSIVSNSSAGSIALNPSSNAILFGTSNIAAYANGNYDALAHIYKTSGTERMRLDSSGTLGLGVTPSAWSSIKAVQVLNAGFGGLGNNSYVTSNIYYDGANWKYLANGYGGFYAIQNGTHGWFNSVSGTAGATATLNQQLTLDNSGNLTATGNVTAYSDERLKTNWRPVREDYVTKLAKIKSGVYDRTDTKETQAGVSAQSLQTLLPETILEGADGTLSVNYGAAAMVSCVELAKVIEELRAEIAELKRGK